MAKFKEIKKRINSVKGIRKTTSAMKLVSSAKLRKAEGVIANMRPYSEGVQHILESLLTDDYANPLSHVRPVERVAIVAFSSDSSLCGAFNANICRELQKTINHYSQTLPKENIAVYTIGKKVYDSIRKTNITVTQNFENLAGKADYNTVARFAASLIAQFEKKQTDCVILIYHRFKSAGAQTLVNEQLLPVRLPQLNDQKNATNYILEPSRPALLDKLIPKSIKLQLYTALLGSNASEHAARMMAMQTATDNADELIDDLTLEYNKSRQYAITNELLDLANGNR